MESLAALPYIGVLLLDACSSFGGVEKGRQLDSLEPLVRAKLPNCDAIAGYEGAPFSQLDAEMSPKFMAIFGSLLARQFRGDEGFFSACSVVQINKTLSMQPPATEDNDQVFFCLERPCNGAMAGGGSVKVRL